MKARLATLIAALLAGCGATGVRVTEEQLQSFQKGESTVEHVIAKLGAPNMRTRLPDGTVMLTYSYSEYSARPASFIPIVGPLVGGADVKAAAATLTFSPNGKLIDTFSTESSYGTATNASSGMQSLVETQQPRK